MRKILVALLIIGCMILGGYFYWISRNDDSAAPVITFPDAPVLYHEDDDRSMLLEGVKAIDEVDGDVSDTLVVESVIPMKNQTEATVIYYAKDKSNNVARRERSIEYLPAEGIMWMTEAETEPEPETETETETEEAFEALPDGAPRIWLTTKAVTVKYGEDYNLLSYVKDIKDDVDGPDWLYGQIHIQGMYDINGPGVYELYYTVVDREGNMSNAAKLVLTIEG